MNSSKDDHERTIAFAEIAFGQIKALRQLASPPHFEIWYAYPTGHSPSLNQMINEMLARDGALTEANIDHIHKTFISPTASPTASTISGPSQRRDRAGHGHDRRRTSGA